MESFRTIPGGVLVASVLGVVDGAIVWGIAALFGVDILVPEGPGSQELTGITIAPIALVVVISAVGAGALLWVLQRLFRERALRIFQVVALVVLVLSLALPLTLNEPAEGQLALIVMHILVGSAIIGTFTWVGTKRRRVTVADLG
jgi:Family of unknown function (DUF6069)